MLHLAQQFIEIGYAEATGRLIEYLEKRREGDDSKFIFKKGEVLVEWTPNVLNAEGSEHPHIVDQKR